MRKLRITTDIQKGTRITHTRTCIIKCKRTLSDPGREPIETLSRKLCQAVGKDSQSHRERREKAKAREKEKAKARVKGKAKSKVFVLNGEIKEHAPKEQIAHIQLLITTTTRRSRVAERERESPR